MRGRGYVLSDFVKSSPKRREYYESTKWLARLLETEEKDGPRMSFFCKPICRCAAHIWMPRLLAPFCFLGSGPDSDRPRGGVYFGGGGGACLPTPHAANCKLQPSSHQSPRHRLVCLPRDCSPQPVSQSPPPGFSVGSGQGLRASDNEDLSVRRSNYKITRLALQQQEEEEKEGQINRGDRRLCN